jgi:hypothetical protein
MSRTNLSKREGPADWVKRLLFAGLIVALALVAEFTKSLYWYFGHSGRFVNPMQMSSVVIDVERGWLRTQWPPNSMYFEKVDLFATDRIVGSFMVTSDPEQVRRSIDAIPASSRTVRRFRWGEGFLSHAALSLEEHPRASNEGSNFTVVLVPAYGVQIATQRPDLLNEIVQMRPQR